MKSPVQEVNRRDFLGTGLAVTGAVAGAMAVSQETFAAMMNRSTTVDGKPVKTKIGLILYTIRDALKTVPDIERSLARVKEIGYDAIEITSVEAMENAKFAETLRKNALAAVSCHAPWDDMVKNLNSVMDKYAALGCRHIVISSIPSPFREQGGAGYEEFAKRASEIASRLKEAGFTFAYHNHSFDFEQFNGKPGEEILRTVGDPKVFNFEIDTYWVQHGGGDPAAWMRKVAKRVPTVHMKDMTMRGSTQLFAEVGEGNMNFDTILKAGRAAGVEYYIVEQDVCQRDPFESIAMSLKNMKAWGLK